MVHAGLVYEPVLEGIWIVIDQDQVSAIGLVRMYLDLFVMFIIFFISGYFAPGSVSRQSAWSFIRSKFKRIMLPWIIAVLTLIPAYKAVFLYSRGLPQEVWYSYFHFYERAGSDLWFFANNPTQSWLWFLPILFVFQLVYLAIEKSGLSSFKVSLWIGVSLTLAIGVIYSMLISVAGLAGWFHSAIFDLQTERLLVYFISFLLGSLCFKLNVFNSDSKNIAYYIIANITLTIGLGIFTVVALNLFYNMVDPGRNYFFISDFADRLIYYITAILSMLSFLYVFLHVFRIHFNKTNVLLNLLNNVSYSVYIIHLVVLGVIALAMKDLALHGFLKFILLTIFTFAVSNILVIAYQFWFNHKVVLKLATFSCMLIALFLFIQFGNKMQPPSDKMEQDSSTLPEIGLHEAVISGDLQVVRQHAEMGTNLDEKEEIGGSTALISAAFFGKKDIAMILIESGADLNLQNNEGSTALHTAAFLGRIEIVELLLQHGADRSITNNAGVTPLQSVSGSMESVMPIYEYLGSTFTPLGLVIDYGQLANARPVIVEMLNGLKSSGG
jgi:hypothetical protein